MSANPNPHNIPANIEWTIARARGYPVRLHHWASGSASYVADTPDGPAVICWGSQDAASARRWLDNAVELNRADP